MAIAAVTNSDSLSPAPMDLNIYFKPFVNQSSLHFQTMYWTLCSFRRPYPIFCIVFLSEDIGR